MSLTEYKRKRNFKKTPEPAGKAKRSREGRQFVVQKHAASRLHYDFRLELDGTLKSWAVPKGPSLDPSVKALAVQVEDHPLDYAGFEGIIPEGEYGGGTVMVWDRGTWEPEGDEDAQAAYKKGKLKFTLHGEKLKGSWALVRMGGRAGEDGKNWLLIKHDDRYAKLPKDFVLVDKKPKSVLSKRTMEQIAAAADRVWSGNGAKSVKTAKTAKTQAAKKAAEETGDGGGRREEETRRKKKVTRRGRVPSAADAAKLTGAERRGCRGSSSRSWRRCRRRAPRRTVAARIEVRRLPDARLSSRRQSSAGHSHGNDWTHRFRSIAEALESLPVEQAILDGEVVSLDERGISDFQQLQNQLKRGDDATLAYYLFDMPYFDGYDPHRHAAPRAKDCLKRVLAAKPADDSIDASVQRPY